jgi:hypothetical protein
LAFIPIGYVSPFWPGGRFQLQSAHKNQCTVTAKGRLMSFQLPPEITVSKDQIDGQWVFTFRHNELGNIGRIRLKGTGANTMINLDVIGPCTFP